MKPFPSIKIEDTPYPTVIMGEDRFTGWFGKKLFNSENERATAYHECLDAAYSFGVRGFSISPQPTLIKVLKKFKKEYSDITCISNHHWQSHYYIKNKSLWKKENLRKLDSTVAARIGASLLRDCYWIEDINLNNAFSDEDIKEFRLDEREYKKELKSFRGFCDFCLVGNIGISALMILGRDDIVKKEIELARKSGFIPLGMCQGGGIALPKIEELNVGGSWVWINRHFSFPNLKYSLDAIRRSKKPITAYKVFTSPKGFNLEESIKFIKKIPQIKSIVVGVENKEQAKETFSRLPLKN